MGYNYILTVIIIVLISYVIGLTIVRVVDNRLGDISINLPKQNVVVQMPDGVENFTSHPEATEKKSKSKSEKEEDVNPPSPNIVFDDNEIEGFSTHVLPNSAISLGDIDQYYDPDYAVNSRSKIAGDPAVPQVKYTYCFKNHCHTTCSYGKTNYPDPKTLSPLDQRYYKYNYQNDFTFQDYINWLWLYKNSQEDLAYEHLKNLTKLVRDGSLEYIPGVVPPKGIESVPINTADYFNKLYNDELNIAGPLMTEKNYLDGANSCQYPTPVVNYQKYHQPWQRRYCNDRNKCEP